MMKYEHLGGVGLAVFDLPLSPRIWRDRCGPEMLEESKRVDILFPRTLPLEVID
jgi:hypothetical protein